MEIPPAVAKPTLEQRRSQRWARCIDASRHKLRWTGCTFICTRCKVVRGPSRLDAWLRMGGYPGSNAMSDHLVSIRMNKGNLGMRSRTGVAAALVRQVLPVLEILAEQAPEDEGDIETWQAQGTAPSIAIHDSHQITHRGTWLWCRRCGSYTQGSYFKKLKRPCGEPSAGGRQSLRRVRKGLPPEVTALDWGELQRGGAC